MKKSLLLQTLPVFFAIASPGPVRGDDESPSKRPQYEFEGIVVPPAHQDEEIRKTFSLQAAAEYLQQGALSWARKRKCVTCHTTGSYLRMRPALTSRLGKPPEEIRELFLSSYNKLKALEPAEKKGGVHPTQAAYVAAGLAQWDKHVTGRLSAETTAAMELLFEFQGDDGSWGNKPCWPPLESSAYQGTTVALLAAAAAPEWLKSIDEETRARFEKGKRYLLDPGPPHDYGRLLLLWVATRIPDLLAESGDRKKIIDMALRHQRPDGGWSIRTFARPEEWGDGSRAEKLRGEAEFDSPPSDGHMTGLVILVLRDAGIAADDERIQKGTRWLLTHQRASGRWWTRSLNTDSWHFITFSGTLYPLVALEKCGLLVRRKRI